MTIGDRIKKKRLELGMSQDELAKKCGYKSRSSINKIELSRDMPLNKVEMIAKALLIEPSVLMGWEDENVIEVAQTDVALSNMESRLKEYALKLNELSKDKQELVEKLIDELGK